MYFREAVAECARNVCKGRGEMERKKLVFKWRKEEILELIQKKRGAYRRLLHNCSDDIKEEYRRVNRAAELARKK